MRIGMSLTTGYSRTRDPSELMDSLVEQVELMAQLGFDSLSLGDHHVTRDHYFQVLPTMSLIVAHAILAIANESPSYGASWSL